MRWDFGDPLAGAANTARGRRAAHTFPAPGRYVVTVHITLATGLGPFTRAVPVMVEDAPAVQLGPREQVLCAGQPLRLVNQAATAAGTRYRWQDGAPGAAYPAATPGWYWLEATSAAGCVARDSVWVSALPGPPLTLGPDTSACLAPALVLRVPAQPAGTSYRWQDGSTAATYAVTRPGTYWVEVRTAAGCRRRAQRVITSPGCVGPIPTILTPNGDGRNDFFTVAGVRPGEWRLQIYSRWGRLLYQQQPYDNHWGAEGAVDGVYYYLLTHPPTGAAYRGYVQVVR